MIVYLHGFRSSPLSFKARLLKDRMHALGRAADYRCPQLPASPAAAAALLLDLVSDVPAERLCLIGSSLGGFYAVWLAERVGCRAVLLNPAVDPASALADQVGPQTAWHGNESFDFKPEHLDELSALKVERLTHPERYLLLAATGDELLDWRDMSAYCAGASQIIIEGSDHGLSDFADHMNHVLAFCDAGARKRDIE